MWRTRRCSENLLGLRSHYPPIGDVSRETSEEQGDLASVCGMYAGGGHRQR